MCDCHDDDPGPFPLDVPTQHAADLWRAVGELQGRLMLTDADLAWLTGIVKLLLIGMTALTIGLLADELKPYLAGFRSVIDTTGRG